MAEKGEVPAAALEEHPLRADAREGQAFGRESKVIENRVKRVMREGGMALGAYTGSFAGPTVVEIIGLAGFDAAFIDMEHDPFDLNDVLVKVIAAERMGITPIVRPPGFDPDLLLRLLDMGVQGFQVPGVGGARAAHEVVQAVRYAPIGQRGMMGYSRAAEYGRIPLLQHVEESNRELLLTIMIEGEQGLDEVGEIARTEGVDLVGVGPADFAQALGVSGQANHPTLVAAIDRVIEAVKGSGNARLALPVGHSLYPRTPAQLRELGVGYTNLGPAPQIRLLRSFTQQVAEVRGQGTP